MASLRFVRDSERPPSNPPPHPPTDITMDMCAEGLNGLRVRLCTNASVLIPEMASRATFGDSIATRFAVGVLREAAQASILCIFVDVVRRRMLSSLYQA